MRSQCTGTAHQYTSQLWLFAKPVKESAGDDTDQGRQDRIKNMVRGSWDQRRLSVTLQKGNPTSEATVCTYNHYLMCWALLRLGLNWKSCRGMDLDAPAVFLGCSLLGVWRIFFKACFGYCRLLCKILKYLLIRFW